MKFSYFASLVGAALMLAVSMTWVDPLLSQLVHQNFSPALDQLFDDLSQAANGVLHLSMAVGFYLVSVTVVQFSSSPKLVDLFTRLGRSSLFVCATMLSGGFITLALKLLVARARPMLLIEQAFYGTGAPFIGEPFKSFPSGHAMAIFAVTAALVKLLPNLRWFLIPMACLIALCRVLTLEHFLSDIVVSGAIAFGCAHFLSLHMLNRSAVWPLKAESRKHVA